MQLRYLLYAGLLTVLLVGCQPSRGPGDPAAMVATDPLADEIPAEEFLAEVMRDSSDVLKPSHEDEMAFSPWIGKPMPDLEVSDVDGQPHSLADYRGRIVFLNVWATWCGPCKLEMPDLIELHNENKDSDVVVLGLSNDNPQAVASFRAAYGVPFPLLQIGPDTELVEPYLSVGSIPTTFLIKPDGTLAAVKVGLQTREALQAYLEALRG